MKTIKQTSKQYINSLTILYVAIVLGASLFSAVALYLNLGLGLEMDPGSEMRDIFIYIVPIFVLNGFVTGNLIYKNRLKKIKNASTLQTKMGDYRAAMIVRLAMLEGSAFFGIVVYLITADLIFIGLAGIVLAYMLTLKPNFETIAQDLELSQEEIQIISKGEEIIAEYQINN